MFVARYFVTVLGKKLKIDKNFGKKLKIDI